MKEKNPFNEQNSIVLHNGLNFEVRFYDDSLNAIIALTHIKARYKMLITHDEGVEIRVLQKHGMRVASRLFLLDLEAKYKNN